MGGGPAWINDGRPGGGHRGVIWGPLAQDALFGGTVQRLLVITGLVHPTGGGNGARS